ncbi:MAG TPA: DNA (cytosine-5-)-methyltransferase [Flavobacterium sp.]|nr:DNA (cytosine-5-)-methyltransferase [Flavobacterium sp.]
MKYISLFAGIGGFDLALNRHGHGCVWANEWDKYAYFLYARHFGEIDTRSITTVPTSEIPDHDLLVGGFPCQAFSIAGKRRGFDDTRGTLFFEIARILKDKQPKFFILENVKGLLSHDEGRTFKTIIATLTDLGYDLQWQVLNSKNFGVPQNRERVFIVGNLRGGPRPQIFPVEADDKHVAEKSGRQLQTSQIARTLTATEHKQHGDGNYIRQLNQPRHSNNRVYGEEGISPTLNTMQGGMRQPKVMANGINHPSRGMEPRKDGLAATIKAGESGTQKPKALIGMQIRRLTPVECERLQGFPDGWTEGVSDTQRYKCLGNAVTVNVVEWIVSNLPKSQ